MSININELVIINNNQATTTSLKIAEYFGKLHKNIIRDIKTLEISQEFRELNFQPSQYDQEMPKGGMKKMPMYEITKDGFVFLTMGFTGAKAAKFKEDYIKAFNTMEEYIKSKQQSNSLSTDVKSLLRLALAELDQKDAIIQIKDQALLEQQPKVEFAERHAEAKGLYDVARAAQLISEEFGKTIGRNNLYKWLEYKEICYRDHLGQRRLYQQHIDNRHFVLKTYTIEQTGQVNTQIFLTPKGLQWLSRKWQEDKILVVA